MISIFGNVVGRLDILITFYKFISIYTYLFFLKLSNYPHLIRWYFSGYTVHVMYLRFGLHTHRFSLQSGATGRFECHGFGHRERRFW